VRSRLASEPVFIDTNIPMYWAGADSPYKASCGAVLSAIESGELKAVTDTEVAYPYPSPNP